MIKVEYCKTFQILYNKKHVFLDRADIQVTQNVDDFYLQTSLSTLPRILLQKSARGENYVLRGFTKKRFTKNLVLTFGPNTILVGIALSKIYFVLVGIRFDGLLLTHELLCLAIALDLKINVKSS